MANIYTDIPSSAPPKPTGGGQTALITCLIVAGVGVLAVIACGVLLGLLLPAISTGREASRRMQCANNQKQIALALLNYESTYRSFPPAYTVDDNGNKLHSWRTLILPFIEGGTVYNSIDLSKPWDDPVNLAAAAQMPSCYRCPSAPLDEIHTPYVVVQDPSSAFSGATSSTISSISDGMSKTLAVVEVDDVRSVPWMAPEDIDLQTFMQFGVVGNPSHVGGANISFCDGSVTFFPTTADPAARRAMATKAAGD